MGIKQRITKQEREHRRHVTARRRQTERHLNMPWADWQVKKRQEWRAVMESLDKFTYGSAYTPASRGLYDLKIIAERVAEAMREDWVSW